MSAAGRRAMLDRGHGQLSGTATMRVAWAGALGCLSGEAGA